MYSLGSPWLFTPPPVCLENLRVEGASNSNVPLSLRGLLDNQETKNERAVECRTCVPVFEHNRK